MSERRYESMDAPSIEQILSVAVAEGASDILIASQQPPRIKVHGRWNALKDYGTLDDYTAERMIMEVVPGGEQYIKARGLREHEIAQMDLPEILRKLLLRREEADFSTSISDGTRFRVNVSYSFGRLTAVFRVIPSRILPFEEIGIPEALVVPHLGQRSGLILVTGPTGSGKSTTLAAMVEWINNNKAQHIVTIEDPVEFFYVPKKAIITQREVWTDTPSFASALRAVLRQAPDVILIGEMRDQETIASALTAAETGHLVFGTLHTNSAAETIERVVSVFEGDARALVRTQLARTLRMVISQALVPKRNFQGRTLVYELLVNIPAVATAIREGKVSTIRDALRRGRNDGMVPMAHVIAEKIREGSIDPKEAQGYVPEEAWNEAQEMLKSTSGSRFPGGRQRPSNPPGRAGR